MSWVEGVTQDLRATSWGATDGGHNSDIVVEEKGDHLGTEVSSQNSVPPKVLGSTAGHSIVFAIFFVEDSFSKLLLGSVPG